MPASNQNKALIVKNAYAGTAALYVHWPFCQKKCPYCDFNSHVRDTIDQKAWLDAYLKEIDWYAAHYPKLKAHSIFFGGGTPSLMPPETTAAIIERIMHHWSPDKEIEVTLEANPSSVEAGRFAGYRAAGVNRISVGIQSLDDAALKFLGRLHSADEAKKALAVANSIFDRVSFDLIYALPNQSKSAWKAELKNALTMHKGHISLYQLTIEEGTAFHHQYKRGAFTLPDEEEALALYNTTQDITEEAGLPAYEVSNHAKKGEESAHNLIYWRGQPFVGIGPGAHGRLPHHDFATIATAQIKRPEDWLKTVAKLGTGLESQTLVSSQERVAEMLMMGLRLNEGVDLSTIHQQTGVDPKTLLNMENIQHLLEANMIEQKGQNLRLSKKGLPLLNFILGKLLA